MKTKSFGSLSFRIDRPKGTIKTWHGPSGDKTYKYPVDYGYFSGKKGEDGEGLDAFVGDNPNGHFEAFQKLKKDEKGRDVLDETKFLVGVDDKQRESIYKLYGREVWARRRFRDADELAEAVSKFKSQRKERYKSTEKMSELADNVHRDQGVYRFNHQAEEDNISDYIQALFARADRKPDPNTTGDESSHGTIFEEGVTG